MKNSIPNPSTHFALETLAKAAVSLQNPKSRQAIANLPNIEHAEQKSKDKEQNLKA